MNHVQPIRDKEKLNEMQAYLKRQSYRDYFLFAMGISTGLRISDLLKLQVKDVKDKTHIIMKEQKTKKSKRFHINSKLRDLIDDYISGLSGEEYLFPSQRTRKPISRVQAYRILNKAAAEVGLSEIGTHTLRKTFGYHHYQRYKDVAILQDIFNHSAPSVTLRYIGINQDIIDKSLEDFSLI